MCLLFGFRSVLSTCNKLTSKRHFVSKIKYSNAPSTYIVTYETWICMETIPDIKKIYISQDDTTEPRE